MKLFKLSSFVFLVFLVINSNVFCFKKCFKIENSTENDIVSWGIKSGSKEYMSSKGQMFPKGKTKEICVSDFGFTDSIDEIWIKWYEADEVTGDPILRDINTGSKDPEDFFIMFDRGLGSDKKPGEFFFYYGIEFFKDKDKKNNIRKMKSESFCKKEPDKQEEAKKEEERKRKEKEIEDQEKKIKDKEERLEEQEANLKEKEIEAEKQEKKFENQEKEFEKQEKKAKNQERYTLSKEKKMEARKNKINFRAKKMEFRVSRLLSTVERMELTLNRVRLRCK